MAIGVDKKTKFYEGEMRYKLIMDFCNVYQETFFRVGEESTPNEEPKKPWMTEKFPEYTKESAGTLCFNVDGALCVLVVNKEKPNDSIQNIVNMCLNSNITTSTYKNLSNANSYSPLYQTKFDNSYYSDRLSDLTNAGWTY